MAIVDTIARFLLPIRAVQAVLAIIVLGLTAYVANWWSGRFYGGFSPSEVNFLIFSSVWTLLALVYLFITASQARFERYSHKYATLAVEALTMLFWFAGFIALAVFLSDRVCYGRVCDSAKAATAFAAFEWLAFVVTTVLVALNTFNTHGAGRHSAAGPEMSGAYASA